MKSHHVAKEFTFEAAHQLWPSLLGVSHKCCRLHGHSYLVRIHCESDELDKRGFVVDYAEISAAMEPLLDQVDHRFLNDVLPFHTTAENIAAWFYAQLLPALPTLARVDLEETRKTICTFVPKAT